MHISIFGPRYGLGGVGRVCAAVGKTLARRGYEVDFLVDGHYCDGGYLQEDLPERCSIIKLTGKKCREGISKILYYQTLCKSLAEYVHFSQCDILISNMTKFNIISSLINTLSGNPTNTILVEHTLLKPTLTGRSHILPYLVKVLYPLSGKIISVSNDIKKDIHYSTGIRSGIKNIGNPLDFDSLTTKANKPVRHEWFREGKNVVVGIGRLVEQKQFSILIKAFRLLSNKIESRLLIIGDGPLRSDLRNLAYEINIEDKIRFTGSVTNPYKYMKRADLLASSSSYEGFGMVLLEAMACGTPVVSSDCPGGPADILGDGQYGELVEVGDVDALADAMCRTIEDPPPSRRLVERSRSYRVDRVVDEYESLFEDINQ